MSASVLETEADEVQRLLDRWLYAKEFLVIGKSVTRVDSLSRVLGKSKYIEDHFSRDMLFARIVKSRVSSADIVAIDFTEASGIPGFVAGITASDVPGQNQVGYYLLDQPALADRVVRFDGEPLALAVCETPESAEEAVGRVRVEYRERPAVYDPLGATTSPILVHTERNSNIAITTKVRKGDVEKGFAESDVIVENTYRTGYQDHAYIEPEGAIAIPTPDGMTIISCAQYPHLAQKIVARVLGVQQRQIRIVQSAIGGAFGGKDDMGPIVAAQAAVAAYRLQRTVMLIYSREDSLTSHCKRDPAVVRYRTGASKDGFLKAIEVDIVFDAGAYANRGPFTLWRGTMHASGPYEIPHAKVDGRLVYTNKVYQGSFRGFGNPPVQLAAELNIDEVSHKIGIDPVEFRLRNLLRPGSSTITGQVLADSVGIAEALEKVAEISSWREKRETYGGISNGKAKGIGVACAWHGISTSRGVPDWSGGYIVIRKDGSVDCYTGIVEIGQGTSTGIAQIVAEALGIEVEQVTVYTGTSDAPDTGATHASRGSSVGSTGMLVAASRLRERLDQLTARMLGCSPGEVAIEHGVAYNKRFKEMRLAWSDLINECYSTGVETTATGYYFVPKGRFDEERGSGFAYPAFSFMVIISEVEVDLETGITRVERVWPSIAAGRILNPALAEGQVHGGIIQGLGYALLEELALSNGKILAPNFTDYLIPTIQDTPQIEKLIAVQDLYKHGPYGAKGVAEMALIPTPAAILSAVQHATHIRPRELPLTPERLHGLLRNGGVVH